MGGVQEVRDDHTARGRAAGQVLPRGQLPAAPPRQLRLRDRARLRLGLPRPVRARPLQLLAGQVHQVLLLRHLLLPEQGGTRVANVAMFSVISESVFVLLNKLFSASVRVPLAPAGGGREVRAAGRRQLQLVAAPHPAAGRPGGRGGAQLGGRQGQCPQKFHPKVRNHGEGPY